MSRNLLDHIINIQNSNYLTIKSGKYLEDKYHIGDPSEGIVFESGMRYTLYVTSRTFSHYPPFAFYGIKLVKNNY